MQLYDSIKSRNLKISVVRFPHSVSDWYVLIYFILNAIFVVSLLAVACTCRRSKQLKYSRWLPPLVSTGIQASDQRDYQSGRQEEDALLGTYFDSYDSYTTNDSYFSGDSPLGWAEEEASCLSKIIFWWVNPMMAKGNKCKLKKAEDLFFLPLTLDTKMIKEIFQSILRLQKLTSHSSFKQSRNHRSMKRCGTIEDLQEMHRKPLSISLFKALNRAFGIVYYSLGILKFLVDCLAFAGPILLNLLISFMENKKEPVEHGYYYALGLLVSTLLAALLDAQYSYQVNKVGLQCRAALITTVYEKALAVSSTTLSAFSSGQIINFMSTDTDRTINFCNSFHQFWSLPFQIAISLYLLYDQVGLAFLAGLGFAILLIPINRWIALKIAELSKTMMEQKDNRVKLMNECLFGIRFIKFCAWEDNLSEKIETLRKAELKSLKGRKYLDALCVYFWATTPVLISIVTFTTYVLLGNKLTAAKVFTSMSLFTILIGPLNAFPWVINGLMEAWVSVKRINRFLTLHEVNLEDYYSRMLEDSDNLVLEIEDGNFQWKGWQDSSTNQDGEKTGDESQSKKNNCDYDVVDEPFCLQDINLGIRKGELVGVIGKVGSGKSSLIAAVTAEMERKSGQVSVAENLDGFGFTSQDAWIQHATIRDNILSGRPFYQDIYDDVIECCALKEDLALFSAGDLTEVGENGVTLSGGQKARIALARAAYQDKDIYLLDDPLAAVDAHVAEHLFNECILGLLGNKTRVLCTHHTKYLWKADYIIVLNEGRIVIAGEPQDILNRDEYELKAMTQDNDDAVAKPAAKKQLNKAEESNDDGKLIEEEEKEEGVVSINIYKSYWKSVGYVLAISIILFLLLMQGSKNVSDWWLAYWISEVKDKESTVLGGLSGNNSSTDVKFYLTVYGAIAGANTVFTLFRAFLFAYGGIEAAKIIHKRLLKSLFNAPISFFDVTPIGRIMNRFSSDLYSIDDSLPFWLNIFLAQAFGVLGTIVVTCYGIPWFAAVLVPLSAIYLYTQNYYRKTSRELKRISTLTLSPIYEHFSETLSGLSTIRALRETARFSEDNETKLDASQRANYAGTVASIWLMLRLQLIGVAMVAAVSFLAVLEHHLNTVDPGLVGLAIAYALSVTSRLSGLVSAFTETEKQMVSVERAMQYIEGAPQEEDERTDPTNVDSHWPQLGGISFKNVKLVYRPGLPAALSDINMYIKSGEKVGICGRTGSGKSSLFLVLFRMVEIQHGTVAIDGVDISKIPVKLLRSKLSIIPQDPFLFDGSIRENVDPFNQYSDSEIMSVLQACHLQKVLTELGGLDGHVGEKGQNLSSGQRQLACLARALLKRARIICIDEATASVDLETDKLIQETIREQFKYSTVLTIAHRIETILDNDRILVMDRGTWERSIVAQSKPKLPSDISVALCYR
eukprot:gene19839-21781_t